MVIKISKKFGLILKKMSCRDSVKTPHVRRAARK
jgi:hypothetical protein